MLAALFLFSSSFLGSLLITTVEGKTNEKSNLYKEIRHVVC